MTVPAARTRILTAAVAVTAASGALLWPTTPVVAAAARQTGAAAAEAPDAVLAPGEPPLTRRMVREYGDFLCYLIDAPLTAAQRDYVRDALVADWKKKDAAEIKDTLEALDAYGQIRALPTDQQKAAVPLFQKEVLAALRADRDKNPHARWLLAIYDTAHKPLAAGKKGAPALTRQMTDAYLEVTAFQIAQAAADRASAKAEAPPLDAATRNAWAKEVAAAYPKLSAADQKEMAELPLAWAALRIAWPRMTDAEREQARRGWRQTYAPQLAKARKDAEKATKAAAAPSAGTKPSRLSGSDNSYKSGQAALAAMAAHRNMMDFSMRMHYSRINTTNTLGGNPYRYVNSWGVPY